MGIQTLGSIGKGGIRDKRCLGTWAKGSPGFPGPADFRAWSRRDRTRAKVLPGFPGPSDFKAWFRRGHWAGPVG